MTANKAAEAATRDMSKILPGVPGPLCAGHPASCEALIQAADTTGAHVLRGVDRVRVTPGKTPEVSFEQGGNEQRLNCALVIGADGRTSSVRAHAGIKLHQAPPTHLVAGLLVDDVPRRAGKRVRPGSGSTAQTLRQTPHGGLRFLRPFPAPPDSWPAEFDKR